MTPLIRPILKDALVANRDIDIIACQRTLDDQLDHGTRVFGIRWAARPDLGFPVRGWVIRRYFAGGGASAVGSGPFFLPRTASWSEFETDAQARRPSHGPYFPTILQADFSFLIDLVRLVDPRTPSSEWPALVTRVANFFGQSHEGSAELAWHYWQHNPPPPLNVLLAGSAATAVMAYYRDVTTRFLYALSLRFEYACLLGMATDDSVKEGNSVEYEVVADWHGTHGIARTDAKRTNAACAPRPPAFLNATRTPGSVSHPAFAAFAGWVPPAELAPTNSDGTPLAPEYWVPRSPAMFSALDWAGNPPVQTLLHYDAVLYEITRYAHGSGTAASITTPPLPSGALFEEIQKGELAQRSDPPPHYLDFPGMPWPPLEGHYTYRIRGVDYLGVRSLGVAQASVRHHDELAPPSPGARVASSSSLSFANAGDSVDVDVEILWTAAEDFGGPDAAEFRVAARWLPRVSVPVSITSATELDNLTGTLTVASLGGSAGQYNGISVVTADGGYLIKSHTLGTPATIIVYKSAGRLPTAPGSGVIYSASTPGTLARVAKLARRAAVPATVAEVINNNPLEIRLSQAGTVALPGAETLHVYLHGLRVSLRGTSSGAGRWTLEVPGEGDPRATTLDNWRALANHDALLTGTPAIVFPQHSLTVTVTPPGDFMAGLLELHVTAADDKAYVQSPVLPVANPSLSAARGNESAATVAIVSVRSLAPPAQPVVPVYDPSKVLWAKSAANYAEGATYTVVWNAVAGVSQFEVWRALEGGLTGASSTTTDAELRTLASAQVDAFDLCSDQVFSNSYVDSIPGRAPTRAMYRVRSVSTAGVRGPWTDIIGPVHVPDVRAPVASNLLSAGPPSDGTERAVQLVWTQAGPVDGVRFEVEVKRSGETTFSNVGTVPKGTPPDAQSRYSFTDTDVVPGRESTYRVRAVREAKDPIDPNGGVLRDIAGMNSKEVRAKALGQLEPPSDVDAIYDAVSNAVTLSWLNHDTYETVEIRRMEPGRYAFVVVASLPGETVSFIDAAVSSGDWKYQVRGVGISRRADSEVDAEVSIP